MPFGVELPDNLGAEAKTDVAPESRAPEGAQVSTEKTDSPETIKDILDLDKLDRFRFDGKEWSSKELRNSYLMHSDYTKKTQEVASERRYAQAFAADMRFLLQNPDKFDKFAEIYPKTYQDMAREILEQASLKQQGMSPQPGNNQAVPKDPELAEIKGELTEWRKAQHAAEVEKIQSWLDNQFETLSKKHPYADTEVVMARAQILSDQGNKITKEILDKLFAKSNDEIKDRFEKMYKGKVTEQLKAGEKSRDVGSGGGIPGQSPKGFKTIKEATQAFLSDIKSA